MVKSVDQMRSQITGFILAFNISLIMVLSIRSQAVSADLVHILHIMDKFNCLPTVTVLILNLNKYGF